MTNQNVRNLMCAQFGWDSRDVKVEFVMVITDKTSNEYEFEVTHDPECSGKYTKKLVKVYVESME